MKNSYSFRDLFELDLDSETVDPSKKYKMVGVYSYGKGLFDKGYVAGSDTSYKKFYRLNEGQIVLSQLFGWEGAISEVKLHDQGKYVSSQFPTFRTTSKLNTRYASWMLRNPKVWAELKLKAKGMGDRRRTLSPEIFFSLSATIPPIGEQERIVKHLDAIETRLQKIQKLRDEVEKEVTSLLIASHKSFSASSLVKLDELISLNEEKVAVHDLESYPQVGIRSFGNGLFPKAPVQGSDTSYKKFHALRSNMLVMSQVKGWEGAIAVCNSEFDGLFVSPEYRTFTCIPNRCHPDYLKKIVKTKWFHNYLLSATRGVGARRERVRPEKVLQISMPFPKFEQQVQILKTLEKLELCTTHSKESIPLLNAVQPSLLDKVFDGK